MIKNAIDKYGPEAFDVEVLDWATDKQALDHKERFWIAFLDTMDREVGYNHKEGGARGQMCQESLDSMAKKLSERKLPKDHPFTKKGNQWAKGCKRSNKCKEQHSKTMKEGFASGLYQGNRGKTFPSLRRAVICVETNVRYSSRSEAAKHILTERGEADKWNWGRANHISQAIKGGWKALGYHWREASADLT
jgi:hypothetical protein